jgi:hypothetical protein
VIPNPVQEGLGNREWAVCGRRECNKGRVSRDMASATTFIFPGACMAENWKEKEICCIEGEAA